MAGSESYQHQLKSNVAKELTELSQEGISCLFLSLCREGEQQLLGEGGGGSINILKENKLRGFKNVKDAFCWF